jgi:hypothetical protein
MRVKIDVAINDADGTTREAIINVTHHKMKINHGQQYHDGHIHGLDHHQLVLKKKEQYCH